MPIVLESCRPKIFYVLIHSLLNSSILEHILMSSSRATHSAPLICVFVQSYHDMCNTIVLTGIIGGGVPHHFCFKIHDDIYLKILTLELFTCKEIH